MGGGGQGVSNTNNERGEGILNVQWSQKYCNIINYMFY